jgi:hypothetical protein
MPITLYRFLRFHENKENSRKVVISYFVSDSNLSFDILLLFWHLIINLSKSYNNEMTALCIHKQMYNYTCNVCG